MTKRGKLTLALGLVVSMAGAVALYLAFDGGEGPAEAQGSVLYAAKPIPAGTTGAAAVGQGMVKSKPAPGDAPERALTDPSQLAGTTAPGPIAQGQVLTLDLFPPAQTRIGTLRIPEDKTALAVQMPNVPGVAGFAGAGDRINVYGVAKQVGGGGPGVRLVLPDVEVLSVNGAVLAPAQGQPGAPGLVFLLAVTPAEAERLVYLTSFEQLYFSLVPKQHPPVAPTPGVSAGDTFNVA